MLRTCWWYNDISYKFGSYHYVYISKWSGLCEDSKHLLDYSKQWRVSEQWVSKNLAGPKCSSMYPISQHSLIQWESRLDHFLMLPVIFNYLNLMKDLINNCMKILIQRFNCFYEYIFFWKLYYRSRFKINFTIGGYILWCGFCWIRVKLSMILWPILKCTIHRCSYKSKALGLIQLTHIFGLESMLLNPHCLTCLETMALEL